MNTVAQALNTRLDYALAYARKGWPVVPVWNLVPVPGRSDGALMCACGNPECEHPGKHPITKLAPKGLHSASKDERVLTDWYTSFPAANIGIPMGEVSGVVAIDLDTRNDGHRTWESVLETTGEMIPNTATARTGGGGLHYLFSFDPERPLRGIGAGIDIKNKGYIVVEPSNHHSGGNYAWLKNQNPLHGDQIIPVPDWLVKKAGVVVKHSGSPDFIKSSDKEISEIQDALTFIDADDRDNWVNIGHAIKNSLGDDGFVVWDAWSKTSVKYDPQTQVGAWNGFNPTSITKRTIFAMARDNGWVNPAAAPRPSIPQQADARPIQEPVSLILAKNGEPLSNLANAIAYIRADKAISGRVWFCEFRQRVISIFNKEQVEREWSDVDTTLLTEWLQRNVGMTKLSTDITDKAITAVASENKRDECADWLNSLVWDGVARVESLFSRGFGAEKSDYIDAVSRCWMVSMVARALSPGCKVDTMPVFESKQGMNKSQALEALVGRNWFYEASASPESNDFIMCMTGKLLVEMAELDKFSKTDVNAMKRVLSTPVDRYREPYGRRPSDRPRRSVFSGTTNRTDWNRDETGARRFWPVAVGHADLEWIRENREQVFAEAVVRFKRGESWWDFPQEAAKAAQENSRMVDAWEGVIDDHLRLKGLERITTEDILNGPLRIDVGRWSPQDAHRVSRCMTALGWQAVRWRVGQAFYRGWEKRK
jgi:putative DNA primase/helicase